MEESDSLKSKQLRFILYLQVWTYFISLLETVDVEEQKSNDPNQNLCRREKSVSTFKPSKDQ